MDFRWCCTHWMIGCRCSTSSIVRNCCGWCLSTDLCTRLLNNILATDRTDTASLGEPGSIKFVQMFRNFIFSMRNITRIRCNLEKILIKIIVHKISYNESKPLFNRPISKKLWPRYHLYWTKLRHVGYLAITFFAIFWWLVSNYS